MPKVENFTTPNNSSFEYADYVKCISCGKEMLVDIGADNCPNCEANTLIWVDSIYPEVKISDYITL
jgi:hypothetical protein